MASYFYNLFLLSLSRSSWNTSGLSKTNKSSMVKNGSIQRIIGLCNKLWAGKKLGLLGYWLLLVLNFNTPHIISRKVILIISLNVIRGRIVNKLNRYVVTHHLFHYYLNVKHPLYGSIISWRCTVPFQTLSDFNMGYKFILM